jgi:hypothetical protein
MLRLLILLNEWNTVPYLAFICIAREVKNQIAARQEKSSNENVTQPRDPGG